MINIVIFDKNKGGETPDLTKGKYRLIFEYSKIIESILPIINTPKNLIIPITTTVSKKVTILKTELDKPNNYYIVYIDILENPIPVALILAGVFSLLAIFGIYLSLVKIEKIVIESPILAYGVPLAIIAVILFFITKLKR